jgi:hypothetical protein
MKAEKHKNQIIEESNKERAQNSNNIKQCSINKRKLTISQKLKN